MNVDTAMVNRDSEILLRNIHYRQHFSASRAIPKESF